MTRLVPALNAAKTEDYCYVALMPGERGAYALCGDLPEYAEHTAEFVAREIRAGARVERVPHAAANALLKTWLAWKKEQAKP